MTKPRKKDDALNAFLTAFLELSDDEQTEAIERVLDELGIFDDKDDLLDDWQEILKKMRGGVSCH